MEGGSVFVLQYGGWFGAGRQCLRAVVRWVGRCRAAVSSCWRHCPHAATSNFFPPDPTPNTNSSAMNCQLLPSTRANLVSASVLSPHLRRSTWFPTLAPARYSFPTPALARAVSPHLCGDHGLGAYARLRFARYVRVVGLASDRLEPPHFGDLRSHAVPAQGARGGW
eukprot:353466-Chlamydomonas_euryale.AAC.5